MPEPVTLRAPTAAERKEGLPTTKKEAIDRGLTRFLHPDGEERIIRNYGSESRPTGRVTKVSERKGSRGGGSDGSRKQNEAFVTPEGADQQAFNEAMSDAASEGKEGHHVRPIARTADGARFSEARGGSDITQIQQSYDEVGSPLGNQADNVLALDKQPHQQAHKEYDLMDAAIAAAGQAEDAIFDKLPWLQSVGGGVRFGFAKLNRAKDMYDLFMWGQTGEAQANQIAKFIGNETNPTTDIGKRAGDAIANEIEYIKTNGNGNGIYGSKPSKNGPRYVNGNGGY